MLGLNEKLQDLQNDGKTINIAIAGIGQMGKGIVAHLKNHKSFKIVALADKDIDNSLKRMEELGYAQKDILPLEKEKPTVPGRELNPGNIKVRTS